MSATLVSSNTTIKINAAISNGVATNGFVGNSATAYTAPANGYAIVNIFLSGNGPRATVAGRTVTSSTTGNQGVYVGPSQALAVVQDGATGPSASMVVSGVEFVNTP